MRKSTRRVETANRLSNAISPPSWMPRWMRRSKESRRDKTSRVDSESLDDFRDAPNCKVLLG